MRSTSQGKSLAVLNVGSLYLGKDVTLRAKGAQPLAISVADAALIDGAIDLSSSADFRGSGGYEGGTNGDGGYCTDCCVTAGCSGANREAQFAGVGGGRSSPESALFGSPAIVPLVGGGAGGHGGRQTSGRSAGGHGGGALQISAGRLIKLRGIIQACGGGGAGAATDSQSGGGAGGAGGAVLLEAPRVELVNGALVAVNGGSGGTSSLSLEGLPGLDGETGSIFSAGSAAVVTGDARGDGGRGSNASGDGGDGEGTSDNGHGGPGGGAGRIRINQLVDEPVPFCAIPQVVSTTGVIAPNN